MKKSLLFLSVFCLYLNSSAQISLSTSDFAGVNKIIYTATDSVVSTAMIGTAGASQAWNMTALTPDQLDTITVLPYTSAPNAKFSTANLVMKQGYQDTYGYLINSPTSLTSIGYHTNFSGIAEVNLVSTPAEILLNFPFTFNSGFTNNYQAYDKFYIGSTSLGADSVRTKSIVKKTVVADAWGTITTPYAGGPYSVIRVKETKITIDTTEVLYTATGTPIWLTYITSTDSITTYAWWTNTIGYPLATATMDSTGNVSSMEWLKGTGLVGIAEHIAVPGINIYPNPAQYEIHFDVEALKASFIGVYDITGKLINEYAIKNNRATINTTHFANGIYMYSVVGESDTILKQGKFTVSK